MEEIMKRNLINCLIEKSNIEVGMTFEQYRAYRNGELNLAEIKMINDLDFEIGRLNPNTYKCLTIILGILLGVLLGNSQIAYATGTEPINALGRKFLDIVRVGMYWVCLIKGCLEVGKEVTRGGDNMGNIGKIIIKYVLAFATLYIMPWAFDTVQETFAK